MWSLFFIRLQCLNQKNTVILTTYFENYYKQPLINVPGPL